MSKKEYMQNVWSYMLHKKGFWTGKLVTLGLAILALVVLTLTRGIFTWMNILTLSFFILIYIASLLVRYGTIRSQEEYELRREIRNIQLKDIEKGVDDVEQEGDDNDKNTQADREA